MKCCADINKNSTDFGDTIPPIGWHLWFFSEMSQQLLD